MDELTGRFFDRYYYQQQAPGLEALGEDALYAHYLETGWRAGLSPSPYFDVPWYLNAFADVREAGLEPLTHFLSAGMEQLRDPHPAFNMRLYQRNYLAEMREVSPILHYMRQGWREGCKPHPLFWTAWYAQTYLGTGAAVDPFYHFVTAGWRAGCNPNPVFDGAWYREQVPAAQAISPDPLSHYIHVGGRKYSPHPCFDVDFFAAQLENAETGGNLLEHFFLARPELSPCPLFEAGRFAEAEIPLVAYLESNTGGIDPHPFFSLKYYKRLAGLDGKGMPEPLTHYLKHGWREGKAPHPLFDPAFYGQTCPQSAGQEPLSHYLRIGVQEGYRPRPDEVMDNTKKPFFGSRHVLALPVDRIAASHAAKADETIGVFLHLYYTEMTAEMIDYTNHIERENCTIFISTGSAIAANEIAPQFAAKSRHKFEIRICENRGRDVAPMLVGFADRLRQVTYGLHIHTKKSPHYEDGFDAWRRYLLGETLGSAALVENILAALATADIGAVMPEHFAPIKPIIQWYGNFNKTAALLALAGEELTRNHLLDFPSGSMFWFRGDALRRLLALDLRYYHFDPEQGQLDGTLAHTLERAMLYFVEAAGYRWLITKSEAAAKPRMLSPGAISRAGNCLLPTNARMGPYRKYYPQCTYFTIWTSFVAKPRINILVPALEKCDPTALAMFDALREEVRGDFDSRMIATDQSPGPQYLPPEGYRMAGYEDADAQGQDVVEDAAQRYRLPLVARENDIFIATNWCGALAGFDCIDKQESLYGVKGRKLVYFIDDFAPRRYGFSARYELAEQTYRQARTIAVFNTAALRDYFVGAGYYKDGIAVQPGGEARFREKIQHGAVKEKILLLHATTEADCVPLLDVLAKALRDTGNWRAWRFCGVGEAFETAALQGDGGIEVQGRMSVAGRAALASKAALGVVMNMSARPDFAALEMAEAGVMVLAGAQAAGLHGNIASVERFELGEVAARLGAMRAAWEAKPQGGWDGEVKADWFFGGRTNLPVAVKELAARVRAEMKVKLARVS
jgi:hypothetical protein